MRLFVCSFLNPERQAFYHRRIRRLVEDSSGLLRPVPSESAHLTYAFLKDVPDASVGDIVHAVRGAACRHRTVEIAMGPLSVMYAGREARLVYVPLIKGEPQLSLVTADIFDALDAVRPRIPVDRTRSFHITLARFRRRTARRAARVVEDLLECDAGEVAGRHDHMDTAQVVSSDLTPSGPLYTVRGEAPFSGTTTVPLTIDARARPSAEIVRA